MRDRIWCVYVRDADGDILIEDDNYSREAAETTLASRQAAARPDEFVELVEHRVHQISRAEAAKKIRSHWLATYTPEELLAEHEPDWERLRNYEIEELLDDEFGRAWCINDWCPFNGIYCKWQDVAPESVIEETAARIAAHADEHRTNGRNPDMMIGYLRRR